MPTRLKSGITTEGTGGKPLVERQLPPTHPGEMLLEEFVDIARLEPLEQVS